MLSQFNLLVVISPWLRVKFVVVVLNALRLFVQQGSGFLNYFGSFYAFTRQIPQQIHSLYYKYFWLGLQSFWTIVFPVLSRSLLVILLFMFHGSPCAQVISGQKRLFTNYQFSISFIRYISCPDLSSIGVDSFLVMLCHLSNISRSNFAFLCESNTVSSLQVRIRLPRDCFNQLRIFISEMSLLFYSQLRIALPILT